MIFTRTIFRKKITLLGLLLAIASCTTHAMKRKHDGDASNEPLSKIAKSYEYNNSALIPWNFSHTFSIKEIDCTSICGNIFPFNTCRINFDKEEECISIMCLEEGLDPNQCAQVERIFSSAFFYLPLHTCKPTDDDDKTFGHYNVNTKPSTCLTDGLAFSYYASGVQEAITIGWHHEENTINVYRLPERDTAYRTKSVICLPKGIRPLGYNQPIAYNYKECMIAVMLNKPTVLLIKPEPFKGLEKLSDIRYSFR